jgi:hypothetical protein
MSSLEGEESVSFAVEPSVEIGHRFDFPILANARGYRDAVEVGTDLGVFARDFLSRFKGNWLWLVDPYEDHPAFPYDRSIDRLVAVQALMPYHGRFRFVPRRSVEAAPWVARHITPEFVYLDAGHSDEDVAADIAAWWPVLAGHGMLAGHDWDETHPGVISAVERFARENGLVVRLTQETDAPPSWYVYKSEPETLFRRFFRHGETANPHARGI